MRKTDTLSAYRAVVRLSKQLLEKLQRLSVYEPSGENVALFLTAIETIHKAEADILDKTRKKAG